MKRKDKDGQINSIMQMRERMVKRLAKSDNVDRKQKWKKEKESANVENGVLEKLERLVI